ncbi:tetratricopeptide repeat protein [Tundrisphaera lichenicola]|uniref:tetratricopeptide repeat protein n=1 Tax=Tundrisphaera lichenicola TaxID=2029860 RepID=UPI003EB8530C
MTSFDLSGEARLAFQNREYSTALRLAKDHLRRWPGDRSALLMAARAATRSGQPEKAETYYQKAGRLSLDDLHDRAFGLIRLKQVDQAAQIYREILADHPDDALSIKRLAAILMDQLKYKEIPDLAARLIRVPGEEVAGQTLAGISAHVRKDFDQAAIAFGRVLELDPELRSMPLPSSMFWNHLAIDLMAQGRNAEARAHLTRALEHSSDAGLQELLGQTYYHEGQVDEAEHCWRMALDRDPDSIDTLLDLGGLELKRSRAAEAITLLSRATRLSPGSVEAFHNLGMACKMAGDPTAAERYLRRASDLRKGGNPAPVDDFRPGPIPSRTMGESKSIR